MNFALFFATATCGDKPFPYQERLATAPELCELVHAPTGAGKTATDFVRLRSRMYGLAEPPV